VVFVELATDSVIDDNEEVEEDDDDVLAALLLGEFGGVAPGGVSEKSGTTPTLEHSDVNSLMPKV
jgi:hypothetical protein